jgi:predicted secreted Zn-dependent protease
VSVAPVTEHDAGEESSGKRRIGDILLELGFVAEEALAAAAQEQERTGQPLGQILVEHGAITRLELASALAEQWSDQVSITPLPLPSMPPRVVPPQPVHLDDDQYAARLQEAVADLTQRVRLPDENPLDGRLVDLAERVESTVARTQRLEATVATLVESLEGMTTGVEDAFGVLQSGMSGLAMDLARIEMTVTELTARPDEPAVDPALAARVDALWKLVHELAERPHVDDAARGRADELSARLEALADRAALEDVQGSLQGMRASLDDLGELRAAVSELVSRPTGSPDVDARLERLEAGLEQQAAAAPDASAVESLAVRLETALSAQSALEGMLGRIDQRLDAVARDVATRAEASLAEQHATTAARLEAVEARLEAELAASTDPEAARALAALSERIEELSRERHVQEELAARLDGIESRVPTDTVSAADLASVRDQLYQATAARLETVEARLEAGLASSTDPEAAKALAALSERIEELARERHAQEELAARLDALDGRLAGLVTGDELSDALERTREELTPAPAAPDPRIDATWARLDAVEVRLETELASSTDPEAAKALAALSERIEELSRERHAHDELAAMLEALEARVPTETVTGEELAAAIEERTADLARMIDEKLAVALEGQGEPSGVPESVDEELERFRMSLERLGLSIADHDRALTEMRSSRGISARVEELAERVDALATGAPAPADGAAPRSRERYSRDLEPNEMRQLIRRIEDCEEAAHEGREKLMNRLERMASSIDWRLQRLEAGDEESSS